MKIVKEFVLREIAGEAILVPTGATAQEFNGMINLSATAQFIWENVEKVDSFEELVDLILEEFEIDRERATIDAAKFVNEMVLNGFAVPTKADRTW